jgi:hypothetical protein
MKYDNVLIIGNGFDVNLELKTKYSEFLDSEEFVISIKSMKTGLGKYLKNEGTKEKWVDLEILIGKFVNQKLPLNNEIFNSDFNLLKIAIINYLQRIQEKPIKTECVAFDLINKVKNDNNFIINFNYTNSLENLFNKSNTKNILVPESSHIHGSLTNKDIVVGVDDTAKIPESFNTILKKPFGYKGLREIPSCFSNCRNLIIFGHSIGETDFSFFKKVFAFEDLKNESLKDKRQIIISHFREDDCNKLKKNISDILGVEGFRIFLNSGIVYFDVFNKTEFNVELNKNKGFKGLQYL